MKLSTPVSFESCHPKFDYSSTIMLLGSCFSDEIGNKLLAHKFKVEVNPFGTIFNPISIANLFDFKGFDTELTVINEDLFFHHHYHSSIFGFSELELKNKIETLTTKFKEDIKQTDLLILTLGTAFVHELNTNQNIVSNCHKQDTKKFKKRLLSISEIVDSIEKILSTLPQKTKVLLTLSPVRHTKEGMAENQLSKSILRVACHEITQKHPKVSYLPSYEKVIDELRDYRFYKSDLIHPNEQAVSIIYDEFCSAYFDSDCLETLAEVKKMTSELNHKSLYGNHLGHQKFLMQLLKKLEFLNQKVDFSKEIEQTKKSLGL